MTPPLRAAGSPSPFRAVGSSSPIFVATDADDDLPPAIPFDPVSAEMIAPPVLQPIVGEALSLDPFDLPDGTPRWLAVAARLIRPICVGALMAIPTVGAATIGAVALFSDAAATRMNRASIAFLSGIPADVLLLIGVLAGGYTVAKTTEKLTSRSDRAR